MLEMYYVSDVLSFDGMMFQMCDVSNVSCVKCIMFQMYYVHVHTRESEKGKGADTHIQTSKSKHAAIIREIHTTVLT